jgi:hypothetical protein
LGVGDLGFDLHVCLDDCGPDHSGGAGEEPSRDPLDGRELDACFAESGIYENVANGDEDDEGKRVQIREDIVGHAMKSHGSGLGGQIIVDLVVGEPVKGVPEEDFAGGPSTGDFVDPGIVELHPFRSSSRGHIGGLSVAPEGAVGHMLIGGDGVEMETTFGAEEEELDGWAENAALWRRVFVPVSAEEENGQSKAKGNGWQHETQIEANITFGVNHGHLADQSADVDEEVEPGKRSAYDGHDQSGKYSPIVNSGDGDCRIDNDPLALFLGPDVEPRGGDLLSDQGRDIGFETTRANSHDDEPDNEGSHGGVRMGDDMRGGRSCQNDVASNSDEDRDPNGPETAKIGVGYIGAKKRNQVDPELIECRQSSRSSLAIAQRTGLGIRSVWIHWFASRGAGIWLLDEVDKDLHGSIVGQALDQFDKGNGEGLERNVVRHSSKSTKLFLGGFHQVIVVHAD